MERLEVCSAAAWKIALCLYFKQEPLGFVNHTGCQAHKEVMGLRDEA